MIPVSSYTEDKLQVFQLDQIHTYDNKTQSIEDLMLKLLMVCECWQSQGNVGEDLSQYKYNSLK